MLTEQKKRYMEQLSNDNGIIASLAIDQRGALKKMFEREGFSGNMSESIMSFKSLVSTELTAFSSSILLDPEYGLPAAKKRAKNAGLLLAYEQTGYDISEPGRFPDLIEDCSVRRLKKSGADGIKFLLYYDVDENQEINDKKQAFVERIGAECVAEDIPFYLELLSYDASNQDNGSKEFAKVKPRKVNEMMAEFSRECYHVDVLKVEVPVNMNYVEGFASTNEDIVYTREEALKHFKDQSNSTDLPFIFLSAGVSAKLFQETLYFAKEANSRFNGVLCGRATWKGAVPIFIKDGEEAARIWLRTEGKKNIQDLNDVLDDTATSWWE